MKLLVVLALVSAVAAGLPPQKLLQLLQQQQRASASLNTQDVQLVRLDSENDGLGTYSYAFEQTDGTRREEQGELKNVGTETEGIVMKGSYSWVGPDGVTYLVTYIADENGFHPTLEQGPSG